jgi:hypothetical protein
VTPIAFIGAAACALLMGAAIQRGATCTVAAISELVDARRASRLRSLLEASLWVAGGLLLLRLLPLPQPALPTPFALTGWTVLGAARLGNGEWAYLATPLGFYLGCASVDGLFDATRPRPLPTGSPLWLAPAALGLVFATYAAWRATVRWRRPWWTPHTATVSIGLSFLALLLLEGAWAYTDALAELAHGVSKQSVTRIGLFACLLAGAMFGGWRDGLWKGSRPSATAVTRCLAGGLLMGWGSLLIPGSNDGLILLGLPLLWPHAWVAFATMCAVIALAQCAARSQAAFTAARPSS